MQTYPYRFPISIQTVLPENYRQDGQFKRNLEVLQSLHFYGVELNMAHPAQVDLDDVQAFLGEFHLTLTMFASGLTAKTHQLSLSSDDDAVRQQSILESRKLIDFVENREAGIIVGFLKGGPTQDIQAARERFRDSLRQISPYAAQKQVPFLVEATNRYESSVANSLDDTVALLEGLDNPYLRILPDTYHMNIEEADGLAALQKYQHLYDSIHISDNNRYFPGMGAIDFGKLFQFLEEQDYQGGVAIEGNIQSSFIDDVTASMKSLIPFLS